MTRGRPQPCWTCIPPPLVVSSYHGLSLHGVMNVLVWTTFFICGFVPLVAAQAYARPLASRPLGWVTVGLRLAGLVLAGIPLVQNNATVMFTLFHLVLHTPLNVPGLQVW